MLNLDKYLIAITIFIGLLFSVIPTPSAISVIVFIAVLISVGIPHGALDHAIHLKNSEFSNKRLIQFYAVYIGLICAVSIFWYFFPNFAFIGFLAISAYHFGQSQLFYLNIKGIKSNALFFLWGTFLLSFIIWENYTECIQIFKSLEWLNIQLYSENSWLIIMNSSGICLTGISYYLYRNFELSSKDLIRELILLLALGFISFMSNAVITFSIYFGIWHSYRSLKLEYDFINKSLSSFVKLILPFSILGLLFIASGFLISNYYQFGVSIYMVFIILISTLTVPHLFVMDKLYKFYSN